MPTETHEDQFKALCLSCPWGMLPETRQWAAAAEAWAARAAREAARANEWLRQRDMFLALLRDAPVLTPVA